MLFSLIIRLQTSEQDKVRLLETMRRYNEACNYVANRAYELKLPSKYKLHRAVYSKTRDKFNLCSQFVIRVIDKVVEAYKRDKNIKPTFKPLGAIQYDQRNLTWKGIDRVSIMTLQGRLKLSTRIGDYQKTRFYRVRVKGQTDLVYRNEVFYLIAVVDAPEKS